MPFFTEWSCASSFEVILARHSSHFPTRASASRTSQCIFHTLLRRRSRRRIDSLPTISQTSLFTLFYPMVFDHGACFKISISGFKILHSQILLDTSFYHCLQTVIIRSSLLLMNLQVIQFQYGLDYSQTLVFLICTSFPRCHQMGFVSSPIEFRPISNRIPEYHHFEEQL